MKTVSEALVAIMSSVQPAGVVRKFLLDADGLFLAESVVARESSPPFSNSAMDGYCLRSEDISVATVDNPVSLPIIAEIQAGHEWLGEVKAGQSARIMTGAKLPLGADCVLAQEEVQRDQDTIVVTKPARTGQHIRFEGSSIKINQNLFESGQSISGPEIALLASQGVAVISVYKQPVVAVLTSGDELTDLAEPRGPTQIVNSNAYMLHSLIRKAGGVPWILPTVSDDLESTKEALKQALSADVVITSGGVSVGDYDVVKEALSACGVNSEFWKVKMKPGKPLAFGMYENKRPIFGLPGNPVSSWVTFELFVRPAIQRMLGNTRPYLREYNVTLQHAHSRKPGRPEFARGTLHNVDGKLSVSLFSDQGSGSLSSMASAEVLVLLPEEISSFEEGTKLKGIMVANPSQSEKAPFET